MTEQEKTILITRLEERLKGIESNTEKILKQVTVTNGRVTNLEMWRKWLNGVWWFACLLGGLGGAVFGIAFTILTYMNK